MPSRSCAKCDWPKEGESKNRAQGTVTQADRLLSMCILLAKCNNWRKGKEREEEMRALALRANHHQQRILREGRDPVITRIAHAVSRRMVLFEAQCAFIDNSVRMRV